MADIPGRRDRQGCLSDHDQSFSSHLLIHFALLLPHVSCLSQVVKDAHEECSCLVANFMSCICNLCVIVLGLEKPNCD